MKRLHISGVTKAKTSRKLRPLENWFGIQVFALEKHSETITLI